MRTTSVLLLALVALTAAAPHADAQRRDRDRDRHRDRHHEYDLRGPGTYVGGNLTVGQPQGEFGDYVDTGIGGQLFVIQGLDRDGLVGLRLDAGALVYGSERYRVPLSNTIGGRVLVDLNTTNNIAFVGLGPQIGLPDGTLKPYVHGFVGYSYLYTSSSVEGTRYDDEPFASSTNFDDGTFAYGGGAGLYVPLASGRRPVNLDVGFTYFDAGEAEYLREGDIRDNPDGSITVYPVRSQTDLLSFRIGVSVGFLR